jgi:hypothetical protein
MHPPGGYDMKQAFLSLLAAITALSGCSSVGADLCSKANECVGGNEKDEAACIERFEGEAGAAAEYGCTSQFLALTGCRMSKSRCEVVHDSKEFTSQDPDTGEDRCETQLHNLYDCESGASAIDD